MQIEARLLRPYQPVDSERDTLSVRRGNPRFPFAVTAIENKDFRTFGQAQHIADIICLSLIESNLRRLHQGGIDIEAPPGEIIAGHAVARYSQGRAATREKRLGF